MQKEISFSPPPPFILIVFHDICFVMQILIPRKLPDGLYSFFVAQDDNTRHILF